MEYPPIDPSDPLYCHEQLPPIEIYYPASQEIWDYYVGTIVPLMGYATDEEPPNPNFPNPN